MSARTRVNLLEAIERIAERAEESQLSNDFFDSVHKEMTYVSNVMNLHNYQVVLLSVFINLPKSSSSTIRRKRNWFGR